MKNFIVIFLLFNIVGVVLCQNSDDFFTKGNSFYKKGLYIKAIESYKSILSIGKESSQLYYNLGNCYYKLNMIAPAIYNYEKALKLNPRNEDAQNNLIFARRLTLDRIEAIPKTFFERINDGFFKKISNNSLSLISVIFSILGSLLFIMFYFSSSPLKKRFFFTTSCIIFVFLLFSLIVLYHNYNQSKFVKDAIIFSEKVSVKNEPTKNSDEIFILHEGTKVLVIDKVDKWNKIKLIDGKIGWLLSNNLKKY